METTTEEIAALEVIIVGRDKAVAPTEAVAQGIAEVRQARAQVRQARGVAQAASAIPVTVQAPCREVVVMGAPGQEMVEIPPVVLAPVAAQAQAELEALAAALQEADQVVVLGTGAREAELLLEEAQAQADLTGAETDRAAATEAAPTEVAATEAAPTEVAPTEAAVASQATALTATARMESKALVVSKLTNHGGYAPMVENEHD